MVDLMRITTVHPALVHFALGPLPIVVVAYGLAAAKRSERWTFAGDVTLVSTAVLAVPALAFGVVSNAVLAWPGGFGAWRWLHVGFGIGSTAAVVGLALARLRARRRLPVASRGTLTGAVLVAASMLFTGWVGGEILVFRSGMAVRAAANGALAPAAEPKSAPRDVLDAMGRLRGAWAEATTRLAQMVVGRPRANDYEPIAEQADRMQSLAQWLEENGAITLRGPSELVTHALHGHHHEHNDSATRAEHLSEMAHTLRERAGELASAARRSDLEKAIVVDGKIGALCADCHDELR
jgi:hypothetical protein